MSVAEIMKEISDDISDVVSTKFSYATTSYVPNSHDSYLTFERGAVKKGKEITTCVLFVDIRNSVALTQKHQSETMGRLYTAFIKAVIKVGRHHKASTRNIIGDRVMLVFPEENCFSNAVDCAISINHIAEKFLDKQFAGVDFKCGIGIDYGKLKVIKVGIQRNGTEQSENKGLVWTGNPANLASRLTDLGNKKITEVSYDVKYNGYDYSSHFAFPTTLLNLGKPKIGNKTPYNNFLSQTTMTEGEFAKSITMKSPGDLSFNKGKLDSFERKEQSISFPAILFTQRILDGLKSESSPRIKDIWTEQKGKIKDLDCKVYGCGYTWKI